MTFPLNRSKNTSLAHLADRWSEDFLRMKEETPEGLVSLLGLFQVLLDPGESNLRPALERALENLEAGQVMLLALLSENYLVLKELAAMGYDVATTMVKDGEHMLARIQEEDQFGFRPVEHRNDPGVLSRELVGKFNDLVDLLKVKAVSGSDRILCPRLPVLDNEVLWISVALFTGRYEAAEVLWEEKLATGVPWTRKEKNEMVTAWLSGDHLGPDVSSAKTMMGWWKRLVETQEDLVRPIPIRTTWSRTLESSSQLQFMDLKSHVENALSESQAGGEPDMTGVLLRALALAGTPKKNFHRPIDWVLMEAVTTLDMPWLRRLKIDWTQVGVDMNGRLPAFSALGMAASRGNSKDLLVKFWWNPMVKALTPVMQDLWWSLAIKAAFLSHAMDPVKETEEMFKGRYEFSKSSALLALVASKMEDDKEPNYGKPKWEKSRNALARFWEVIVPHVIYVSTPEAAAEWARRQKEALEKIRLLYPEPGATELSLPKVEIDNLVQSLLLDLKLPYSAKASPRVRL